MQEEIKIKVKSTKIKVKRLRDEKAIERRGDAEKTG